MSLGLGVHNEPAEVPRICTAVAPLGVSVARSKFRLGSLPPGMDSLTQVQGVARPSEGRVCLDWSSAAPH